MHKFEIKPELEKKLVKLSKKDKSRYESMMSKISEILNSSDIEHYKNIRYDMKESKRAHIGHFVLIFGYDKIRDFISFEDYDHRDNIYK